MLVLTIGIVNPNIHEGSSIAPPYHPKGNASRWQGRRGREETPTCITRIPNHQGSQTHGIFLFSSATVGVLGHAGGQASSQCCSLPPPFHSYIGRPQGLPQHPEPCPGLPHPQPGPHIGSPFQSSLELFITFILSVLTKDSPQSLMLSLLLVYRIKPFMHFLQVTWTSSAFECRSHSEWLKVLAPHFIVHT